MGFKQIDGKKQILIREDGTIREGLRNLPPDSDRFLYKRNPDGSIKNEWPKLILSLNAPGGGEDIRLLPEIMCKEHGTLPRSVPCKADDFEAKDGDKLNWAHQNVKYVGDASTGKHKTYKPNPTAPKKSSTTKVKTEEHPVVKDRTPPPPPPEEDARGTAEPNEGEEPKSDLSKGSGELLAKEAIAVIENYDFQELLDCDFMTEDQRDKPRISVKEAWKRAEEEYREELMGS